MILSTLLGFVLLAQAAAVSPEQFFVGRTQGEGTVRVMLSGSHSVRVQSRGRMDRSGALILDQRVQEEGKPARNRSWRLIRSGPNRLTGTLTDARGPVTGELNGNVLHVRYRSNEGPSVEQWITFQPDGRTARNRMTFRRFGLTVATVEEVIRRAD
ncbi:MAG TPA: DUF3833 family protein [Allosphingosinicella sp.]|nr:DUF3833 family protein [Allosphingosinicella sp.]